VEDIVQNVKNNGDHKATIKTTAQKQHHGIFFFFFSWWTVKTLTANQLVGWHGLIGIYNNYSNLKQFLISIK